MQERIFGRVSGYGCRFGKGLDMACCARVSCLMHVGKPLTNVHVSLLLSVASIRAALMMSFVQVVVWVILSFTQKRVHKCRDVCCGVPGIVP